MLGLIIFNEILKINRKNFKCAASLITQNKLKDFWRFPGIGFMFDIMIDDDKTVISTVILITLYYSPLR